MPYESFPVAGIAVVFKHYGAGDFMTPMIPRLVMRAFVKSIFDQPEISAEILTLRNVN